MTIAANSYGSTADVAARSPGPYTDSVTHLFTASTNPTLTTAETYIDEISAIVNVTLAEMGFTVPVSQADAKKAIGSMVNDLAADMASASNSAGRFFTERALNGGLSVMAQVRKDVREWVQASANGLEALGAVRSVTGKTSSMTAGIIALDFVDHNETVY
jgi:hypothetical protein